MKLCKDLHEISREFIFVQGTNFGDLVMVPKIRSSTPMYSLIGIILLGSSSCQNTNM